MTTKVENLYLEAENDIRTSNFQEAFEKYETILYEEPGYAPAHNSIGWIYKTQFEDYNRAEKHFMAAIQSDPLYPHPYFHLATVYQDQERLSDLTKHLEKCLKITILDKSWVYIRYGIIHENKGQYEEAIKQYRKAILLSMSNDKIREYQSDIDRCKVKLEVVKEDQEAAKEEQDAAK